MLRHAIRRWLVATGMITAALVASCPVPASAQPSPVFHFFVHDMHLKLGSYTAVETTLVTSPMTDVGAIIWYGLPWKKSTRVHIYDNNCYNYGSYIGCFTGRRVDVGPWGVSLTPFAIQPPDSVAVGDVAKMSVELEVLVGVHGAPGGSTDAKVVVGDGTEPDLAAESAPDLTSSLGGAFDEKVGVQNVGGATVHGAVLAVHGDVGVESTAPRYSNCRYEGDELRTCVFDTDLAPGKSYAVSLPFRLRPDLLAPSKRLMQFSWLTPAEWDEQAQSLQYAEGALGDPGNGPMLALTEKTPGEVEAVGGVVRIATDSVITVAGDNPADLAAGGARVTGAVGAEVEAVVVVKNEGRVSLMPGRPAEYDPYLLVRFPDATDRLYYPPDDCEFGDYPELACKVPANLPAGAEVRFVFKFRITSAAPNLQGQVRLANYAGGRYSDKLPPVIDANPDNNVAYVVLNPTASETPSAPASPSPSGDGNGGLPVTGTPVAIVAGVGLALAAGGFVLFRLARRRRLTEV